MFNISNTVISLLTTAIKCKAQQITNQNLRVVTLRKYAYLMQASMHCLKKELKGKLKLKEKLSVTDVPILNLDLAMAWL